jgi:outer membrane lipoprotein-sorting protein
MLRGLAAVALFALPLSAQATQTADDIIAKYIKTIGGLERIQAVQTLRRTGRFTGGGGFEAVVVQESKRPNRIREEFSLQGMTAITAYDGQAGWKIEPWQGKKDPEALSEEELRDIVEESDFDGPLINYQQKGNRVEFVGMEQVEGTDAYKLKVTLANGDVRYYYMDTDYYVPIKIETKRMIRGAEQEFETSLGDYKAVNGWYLPYSYETGPRGSQDRSKITFQRVEANVSIDDGRFVRPAAGPATPSH